MVDLQNITFSIEGMSCGHCKHSVESAIKSLSGVSDAVVDLEQNTVKVTYDEGAVKKEELTGAIEAAGYRALQ